jgi:hypothetical protein
VSLTDGIGAQSVFTRPPRTHDQGPHTCMERQAIDIAPAAFKDLVPHQCVGVGDAEYVIIFVLMFVVVVVVVVVLLYD